MFLNIIIEKPIQLVTVGHCRVTVWQCLWATSVLQVRKEDDAAAQLGGHVRKCGYYVFCGASDSSSPPEGPYGDTGGPQAVVFKSQCVSGLV